MKPEELRIGNLVRGNGDPNKFVARVSLPEIKFAHLFDPIPLTEEWLEKFGFHYQKCGISGADMWQGMDIWTIGEDRLTFRGNPKSLRLAGFFNNEIKYVHQLQNLYFALTGKELECT